MHKQVRRQLRLHTLRWHLAGSGFALIVHVHVQTHVHTYRVQRLELHLCMALTFFDRLLTPPRGCVAI
jgi:hypothetical protein